MQASFKCGTLLLLVLLPGCSKEDGGQYYTRTWSAEEKRFLMDHLTASIASVRVEIDSLSENQWRHIPEEGAWSVALVVEHLITHDELFSREVRVLTQLPELPSQPDSLFSDDDTILSYREITPQNIGNAPDYLMPLGRWCSKEDAIQAYSRVRSALVDYIANAGMDFRKYYTTSGRGPTKYRDLHQLMLISIAHTERHLQQIRNIKSSPGYPN